MTPIATFVLIAGEPASLITRPLPAAQDFSDPADYVPPTPEAVDVMGVPEGKQMREGMPQGATSAFTFEASEVPADLRAMDSELWWPTMNILYTVVDYRPRIWRGEIDGVTLFLKK